MKHVLWMKSAGLSRLVSFSSVSHEFLMVTVSHPSFSCVNPWLVWSSPNSFQGFVRIWNPPGVRRRQIYGMDAGVEMDMQYI